MKTLLRRTPGFFFEPISASGFSLMRIAWSLTAFCYYLLLVRDVPFFYGPNGILPESMFNTLLRTEYRFSLLLLPSTQFDGFSVGLHMALLLSLLVTTLGLFPKISTIISVVLMFSFHERNILILGGGDTVMRMVGFLLLVAPRIDAFSLQRAAKQWRHWKQTRTLLPPITMPIWPWRMLLWQAIVIYSASISYKLMGNMWLEGTAIAATLQHPDYTRLATRVLRPMLPYMYIADYGTLLWQALWLLLLVPRWFTALLPFQGVVTRIALRRLLMFVGIFFHGAIYVFMDAGLFSLAMFCMYIGLLRETDLAWMRSLLNKKFVRKKKKIVVLYDGHCGLCLRSMFVFVLLDNLHRLQPVDFREKANRTQYAPDVPVEALDKALHLKTPTGTYLQGFYAFRYLSKNTPILWPVWPFLFVPGVPFIGEKVYARIAERRETCTHEDCRVM